MAASFPKIFPPLLLAFLLLMPPTLAAPATDKDSPPPPSSGKVVGSTRVVRGQSCEIVLRGIAMPGDTVEFKVAKGPAHGSLGPRRRIDRVTVAYPYRHHGAKEADSDRVLFKLQTGPDNAWSPLPVDIAVAEPASRLVLPGEALEFGEVPIGESRVLPLKMGNGGGGVLRGSLEVGAPWSVEGPAEFELAEGGFRTFRIEFSPDGPGARKGRLDVLIDGKSHPVSLAGSGVFRFEIPEPVSFEQTAGAERLSVALKNRADVDLRLALSAPPPVLCPPFLDLPAGGSASLDLRLEKRHFTEMFVDLSIADGPAVKSVRVDLPPPPALLEWAAPKAMIDLGEIPPRNIPRPTLELRNRGATPATVVLREGEGGLGLPENQARTFLLQPGETAEIQTVWRLADTARGPVSATLTASHGGLDHPVRLSARIVEPVEPEKNPAASAPAASPEATPAPLVDLSEADRQELARRLPRRLRVRAIPAGSSADVVVTWNYAGPEPVRFWLVQKIVEQFKPTLGSAFEERVKVPVPEDLPATASVVKWVPLDTAEHPVLGLGNGTWQTTVTGLDSGFHEFRLASRTPPDGPLVDFTPFMVEVDPLPPDPRRIWVWVVLGALCLLYLLRKKIRRPL